MERIHSNTTSTQTEAPKVFAIRSTSDDLQRLLGLDGDTKRVLNTKYAQNKSSQAKTLDSSVEDTIFNKLLAKKIIITDNAVFNTWLKDPFNYAEGFYVYDGRLVCIVSKHFSALQAYCEDSPQLRVIFGELETALSSIVNNRKKYFDKFQHLKYRGECSLAQVFALFMLWLSRPIIENVAAFIVNYVTLLYMCIRVKIPVENVVEHFSEEYVKNQRYPEIEETEALYKELIGADSLIYIESQEMTEFLVDYFVHANTDNEFSVL